MAAGLAHSAAAPYWNSTRSFAPDARTESFSTVSMIVYTDTLTPSDSDT